MYSMGRSTNETLNIWTHFIGALLFVSLLFLTYQLPTAPFSEDGRCYGNYFIWRNSLRPEYGLGKSDFISSSLAYYYFHLQCHFLSFRKYHLPQLLLHESKGERHSPNNRLYWHLHFDLWFVCSGYLLLLLMLSILPKIPSCGDCCSQYHHSICSRYS